jgi:predicted DNA-binding transcriptional regulator YafY
VRYFARGAPPATGLTEGEKLALGAAQASFAPWFGTPLAVDLTSALFKVGAAGLLVDSRGPVSVVRPLPSVIEAVATGLREHRVCTVAYLARGSRRTRQLEVEPLRLVTAGGLMYLRAAVRPARSLVTLALHLAGSARLQAETFVPQRDHSTAFGVVDDTPERVVVRFQPDIAPFIEERKWHRSQKLIRERGGALRFEARLSGMYEFVGWVMSWGPRAELLEPAEWRQEVARRAEGLLRAHATIGWDRTT